MKTQFTKFIDADEWEIIQKIQAEKNSYYFEKISIISLGKVYADNDNIERFEIVFTIEENNSAIFNCIISELCSLWKRVGFEIGLKKGFDIAR